MTSSSVQVKVAWRDLMRALYLWRRDVMARVSFVTGHVFGRFAGMTKAEINRRFPPPKRKPVVAPTPVPAVAESSVSQTKPVEMRSEGSKPGEMRPESSGSMREPKAVVKSAPKKLTTVSTSESVVPPNIERAVNSQLTASNKDRMTYDEIYSFMTAFGVGQNDAKGTLALLRTQTKRDYVVADDLAQIQTWISKSWIAAKRRTYRHFEITLREQFGLEMNAVLEPTILCAELVKRGFYDATATDLAAKLVAKEWH